MGWTGTFCDITLNSNSVVKKSPSTKDRLVIKTDGTRLSRDRRDEEEVIYREPIVPRQSQRDQLKIKQISQEALIKLAIKDESPGFFSSLFGWIIWM